VESEQDREVGDLRGGEAEATTSDTLSLVIFRLGERWYALPTVVVKEVAEVGAIRSIPQRSSAVLLGLVNLRGVLYLCVSLDALLGRSGEALRPRVENSSGPARLVVVEDERERWVFPVDEVSGVFHFLLTEIQAIPARLTEDEALAIKGIVPWQERSVSCMDEKVLFNTLRGRIS